MPALAVFLIVLGAVYHLFFRFERWHNTDKPGIVYEHDNLTGETREMKPDGRSTAVEGSDYRADVSGRILGDENGTVDDPNAPRTGNSSLSPEAAYSQEQASRIRSTDAGTTTNLWGEPLIVDNTRSEPRSTGSRRSGTTNSRDNGPPIPEGNEASDEETANASSNPSTLRLRPTGAPVLIQAEVRSQRRRHIERDAVAENDNEGSFVDGVGETRADETIPPVPTRATRRRIAATPEKPDVPALKSWDWRDESQVEKVSKPVPTPRRVMMATSAPPVPVTQRLNDVRKVYVAPFAVQKVDLNHDGASEDVIQSAERQDGLLNISIVQNGREIFFGRGRQIALLPGRTRDGWADIALKAHGKVVGVFRYNPAQDMYTVITNRTNPG
jgi:hypothetical protein